MKKKIFFVAAVLFSSYAHAQQDSAVQSLDEVIVTANRIQQKQSSTGKTVTVIGKDVLEKSKGRSVAQVLNEQAGIAINGALNNTGSVQTVYMRGANSGRVLVLLDGIPVGDPSFISNEVDLNFFSLNDVERIEIAKGCQSTLYGSDAIAGVINIITIKKNMDKPFNFKTTLSAGNYKSFRGNLQFYGKSGKFSYQTKFTSIGTGGFSAAHDSTGKKGFDHDGYFGNLANASLQYQANKNLSFRTFLQHSSYKSSVDGSAFVDDKDFTINNRNLTTGVGFQFKNSLLTLTGNYQYSENKRKFLNDSGFVSGFSKYDRDNYFSKSHYAEMFATIPLNDQVTLIQGFDYRRGSYNNNYLSISAYGPYTSSFRDTSVNQLSLFNSLLYVGPSKKLNIELGARLNIHSRYGSNHTFTFSPSYSVNNHFRLFGSIATGYKAPGLYQLYSEFGNQDLKPEESINYEAGMQHQLKNLTQKAVFFYREIKNGIDFDNNNYVYFNFPKQNVRGFEYEASLQLSQSFSIKGNYTYINGTDITQSRLTFKDTSYNYLLRRPAHNVNLILNYRHKEKYSASISGKYVSDRLDVTGYQQPDGVLKGYFLFNAYADFSIKSNLRVFADVQNITNSVFYDQRGYNSIPFMLSGGITLTGF